MGPCVIQPTQYSSFQSLYMHHKSTFHISGVHSKPIPSFNTRLETTHTREARSHTIIIHPSYNITTTRRRRVTGVCSSSTTSTSNITPSNDNNNENNNDNENKIPHNDDTRLTSTTPSPIALALAISAVIITGIGNRVLSKMALAPMGNYVFFLSQFQTFGYVLIYTLVLSLRTSSGLVSKEMLSIPRKMPLFFITIGCVEALSSLLTFISAANLPGVVLPLFSQTVLFWQVLLAYFLLKKRFGWVQIAGVACVVSGVIISAWPSVATSPSILANVNPLYAFIFLFSMIFPAFDTILKERVFRSSREILNGQDLDLFVVNTFGSISQAAFVFLLLPVVTAARGMSLYDLPSYLHSGWQCFNGISPACGVDCSGAPILPIMYVIANLLFNVAALNLIRQAGNVVMSLVMSAIIPATIVAFTLPLPYLEAAPPLGLNFVIGAGVLCMGLAVYNSGLWMPGMKKYIESLRRGYRLDGEDDGFLVTNIVVK